MEARVIRRWERPDHGLSFARGNVQILPNSNAFVAWSDDGYVSEFTDDGLLVFEGRFASHRFTTYRTYKFNFTSNPVTNPDLASYVYSSSKTFTIAYYVSWNGATEVSSWRFYGSADNSSFSPLGTVPKSGFETTFISDEYAAYAYVEALDLEGVLLGKSLIHKTVLPSNFVLDSKQNSVVAISIQISGGFAALVAVVIVCTALAWLIRWYTKEKEWSYDYKRVPNESLEPNMLDGL